MQTGAGGPLNSNSVYRERFGLLHSGNRDESQSICDEERKMLINCISRVQNNAFAADLDMEAHRKRIGETALRISSFAGRPS